MFDRSRYNWATTQVETSLERFGVFGLSEVDSLAQRYWRRR